MKDKDPHKYPVMSKEEAEAEAKRKAEADLDIDKLVDVFRDFKGMEEILKKPKRRPLAGKEISGVFIDEGEGFERAHWSDEMMDAAKYVTTVHKVFDPKKFLEQVQDYAHKLYDNDMTTLHRVIHHPEVGAIIGKYLHDKHRYMAREHGGMARTEIHTAVGPIVFEVQPWMPANEAILVAGKNGENRIHIHNLGVVHKEQPKWMGKYKEEKRKRSLTPEELEIEKFKEALKNL